MPHATSLASPINFRRTSQAANGPRRRLAAVVMGLAILSACGRDSRSASVAVEPNTSPNLPSARERLPDLFDSSGCLEVGDGAGNCSITAADVDEAAAGTGVGPEIERRLLGFTGPLFNVQPAGAEVVVLEETVAVGSSELWDAAGLVRNESRIVAGGVIVRAEILGPGGQQLESVVGEPRLNTLRPGEPAPFSVHSNTPAHQVAEVRWSVDSSPAASGPTAEQRAIEITPFWSRPFGDSAPVNLYLYTDQATGPHPYLLFGAVINYGTPAASARIIAAWIDGEGRVLAIDEVEATCLAGRLDTDVTCDFLFALDDPVAGPALLDAGLLLWGITS